jgi:uncharacterized damage-inducible protein DinB
MDPNQRRQILTLLEEGRAAVPASVAGISDETAARIPAPGRWSILGCVEHIAISEDYLFEQIGRAVPSSTPAINPQREAKMLARGTDRTRRIESPPEGHPSGTFPSLAAAVVHFIESRDRTIEFVQRTQDDLRTQMTWHPILGAANNYEMLISMGVHALRHVGQIEEIKAGLG